MKKREESNNGKKIKDLFHHPMACRVLERFLSKETLEILQTDPTYQEKTMEELVKDPRMLMQQESLPMLYAALEFLEKQEGKEKDAVERFEPELPSGDLPIIICMGDSITYGAGVQENRAREAWVSLLKEERKSDYEILNYGMSGATLQDEGDLPYTGFSFVETAEKLQPEKLVFMFGTNDSKPQNFDVERFEKEYRSLIRKCKSWKSVTDIVLLTPTWVTEYPQEGTVIAGIQKDAIQGPIRSVVEKLASEESCKFLDLYQITEGHPEYFADGVHPDTEGNKVIFKSLEAVL